VEGVRARADAGRRRQRRGHLLDRERRPDGVAHRRQHHRRAADDADRPRVQRLRDIAIDIIRRRRLAPGGCNIQFAVDPSTGAHRHRDEPQGVPLVGLASKATGFPIAKIAAKLAVGYTLDEIRNDITAREPASFEPPLDYVVSRCRASRSRSSLGRTRTLTTTMKRVGEVMAIGRYFTEALQRRCVAREARRELLVGGATG
jgi:carbamoyl-phosphate synthase large subunit